MKKRIVSVLLTLCIAFLTLPELSFTAAAQESEQQQSTDDPNAIIDEFGLSRAAEEDIDLDEQVSPFGEGVKNLNPISELYMRYAGGSGSAVGTDINGYLTCNHDERNGALFFNNNKLSGFLKRYGSDSNFQGNLGQHYNGPGAITGGEESPVVNSWSSEYNSHIVYSSSVALSRGTGKDNMVAELTLLDNFGIPDTDANQLVFNLYELSSDGSPCDIMSEDLGMLYIRDYASYLYADCRSSTDMKILQPWEADTFTEITAGDFNGDGRDEVAMYIPSLMVVRIYNIGDSYMTIETELPVPTPSNMKTYPCVSLTTSDLRGDYSEELVIATSSSMGEKFEEVDSNNNTVLSCSRLQVYDFTDGYGSGTFNDEDNFVFLPPNPIFDKNLKWDRYDMLGTNVSSGDINGDGVNELVIAGYQASMSVRSGSYYLIPNPDVYLYTWMTMKSNNQFESGTNNMLYAAEVKSEDFSSKMFNNLLVNDGTFGEIPSYEYYYPPIPLEVVSTQGDGYPAQTLIGATLYGWNEDGIVLAHSSRGNYSINDSLAQKCKGQMSPFVTIEPKVGEHVNNDYSYTNKDVVWLGSVISGNFDGNPYGQEQLLYSLSMKANGANQYWVDIGSLSKIALGGAKCAGREYYYLGQEQVFSCSAIFNEQLFYNGPFISIAAVDYDDDATLARPLSRSLIYDNVKPMAVLQSAPYFRDLNALNSDYASNGSTAFGNSSSSSADLSVGASVSTIASVEIEQDLGGIGLKAVQVRAEATVTTSFSTDLNTGESTEIAFSYETSSDQDSVIVYATPYVCYRYEVWIPEYSTPADENEYLSWIDERLMATYPETAPEDRRWSGFSEDKKKTLRKNYEKFYPRGITVNGFWTPMKVNVPQPVVYTIMSVDEYDEIAARNPYLEPIRGNILKNVNGEPASYTSKPDVLFSPKFHTVIGGSTGSSSITISGANSNYSDFTIGFESGFEVLEGAGVAGFTAKYDAGGSIRSDVTIGQCYVKSFSGTVASLPAGASDYGYSFDWNFGYSLRMLNGRTVPVLGYQVRNVLQPPSLPTNIDVDATTTDSVTLNWERGYRPANTYSIFDYDPATGINHWLASVPGAFRSFDDVNLAPNTVYSYRMQSQTAAEHSAFSEPITTRTQPEASIASFSRQPKDAETYANGSASFSVKVAGVSDFTNKPMFQWEKKEDSQWKEIPGANSSVYSIGVVEQDYSGTLYRCRAYKRISGNMVEIISKPAQLIVNKAPLTVALTAKKNSVVLSNGNSVIPNYEALKWARSISGLTQTLTKTVIGDTIELSAVLQENQNFVPMKNVVFNINCIDNPAFNSSISISPTETTKWTPPGEGVYKITANCPGDVFFHRATSSVLELNAFKPNSASQLLTVEPENMTYGETQDFKAYLSNKSSKSAVTGDITYTIIEKGGNIVDSSLMSKSDSSSDIIDRFTPNKAGDYTVEAEYNDGSDTVKTSSNFTVYPAVLIAQAPSITRYVEQSYPISTNDLILTGQVESDYVDKNSFKLTSIYNYDSEGNPLPVPTEANKGECGSYPLIVQSPESLSDRYNVITKNSFYTIIEPVLTSLPTNGLYFDILEAEVQTSDKLVVYVRCLDDTECDLSKIKLFKAEYDSTGKLVSVVLGSPQTAGNRSINFTTALPNSDSCKLLLWDQNMQPITNTFKATKVGTSSTEYIWTLG